MQKVLVIIVAAFIAYGCASTSTSTKGKKEAVDVAIGTWDYLLKDTPNGDMEGAMVFTKVDGTYTGVLKTDMGDIELSDVEIVDNKLSSSFEVQGMELDLKGTFTETTFDGNVSVEYNDFPLTATKRE